jgi:hypothetical protein
MKQGTVIFGFQLHAGLYVKEIPIRFSLNRLKLTLVNRRTLKANWGLGLELLGKNE